MVNKRVRNAVFGCNLKNDRMISVCFQGKPFSITVIQVYAPTSNAEEAERFYEDLQDVLELTPKKRCLLQYQSLKTSILQHSAFFTAQLSHPYMITGKTIALTRWTFVGKVCLGNEQRSFCRFWDCIQVLNLGLFCWPRSLLHFF